MASLASAFSEYAHLPEPHPESLDLLPLIQDLAEREIPPEVRCTLDLRPLPLVWADRDEVERMLRNLIKNAIEAMEGAGSLRIETRAATDGEPIRIDLVDSGPGIDEATLEKVFHPGFTTKPTGTGLGLALVRSTVIRMGGRLSIESKVGEGTRVILRLPAAAVEKEGE
jgi:signal transduction histidine kinase